MFFQQNGKTSSNNQNNVCNTVRQHDVVKCRKMHAIFGVCKMLIVLLLNV